MRWSGCLAWLLVVACNRPPTVAPKSSTPPAKVERSTSEVQLATITLTDAAAQRLNLDLARVERRTTERWRTVGGTASIPVGRTARVVAPVAARVIQRTGTALVAGAAVSAGQPLFALQMLQPEAILQRASAQRDAASAQIAADAASTRHRRAEQMLAEKTGSVRAVEEAAASLATAKADLVSAQARLAAWSGPQFDADGNMLLLSPIAGTVLACDVVGEPAVAAGALLCEVAALDPIWIRVPMHAADVAKVDGDASARIHPGFDRAAAGWCEAKVAAAPPAADAASASVDLVYELANAGARLRPGERVLASVRLRGQESNLVVPRSAIVVDVNGGTWVYVRSAPSTFARCAVQVAWIEGAEAMLIAGPAAGTEVVVRGAAELFGAECGQGK